METKVPLPKARYEALFQVLRTADQLWDSSRVFFARWHLSPSQFNVLNLLQDRPEGLSQVDLGRLLIMHRSNLTGLVDRLEKRRLVERGESADRRAYRVVLTPAGRSLLRQVLPEYYKAVEALWAGLPAGTASRLAADLARVGANAGRMVKTKA